MAKSGLVHSNEPIHVKQIWKFNFKTVWPLIWPLWPSLAFSKFYLDFQGLRSLVPCSNHLNSYCWKFALLNQCEKVLYSVGAPIKALRFLAKNVGALCLHPRNPTNSPSLFHLCLKTSWWNLRRQLDTSKTTKRYWNFKRHKESSPEIVERPEGLFLAP